MAFNHRKTITFRLAQTARAARGRSGGHLIRIGLHPGQESVLKALAEQDGLTMSQLAQTLAVQPPTVTKMVSRLAAQGYVERRASKGDGRQAHVFLTEQGRDTIADVDRGWKRLEKEALAGIDEKDVKRLRKLLRQIERNLTASHESADDQPEDEPEAEDVEIAAVPAA
ncbi:DNA-binding MarR family transcriptional regulator [Kaistia hirudinis]|uniref:DNA-binding MarR family transcriptional regulator n=1 Tax=Kaistia hirudinis TaxID=1293440 RepID=A0A840ARU7_9HYPH|nr:MarR family winged helix-turn-helix transcriptional regulator [Kaistia hirudinis]MBB3931561.1 DNA-binding MarR family transcriptional regulator [Kaistia hirudinis]